MTVHIFMANLAYAIRRRETVTIGGGEFDWTELAKVAQFMEEAVTKVAPKPGFSRARTLLWTVPVHDKKSAEAFLRLLDANGLAFHCDDDPADVVGPAACPCSISTRPCCCVSGWLRCTTTTPVPYF